MAKIFIKFNEAIINEVSLTKDETTFGRKDSNDIVINHPAVSGHHGKIVKEGAQFFIVDLNSTNGTQVNGRKVSRSALSHNDNVRVAKHILQFVTDEKVGAPAAPPSPASTPAPASPPPAPPPPKKEEPKPVAKESAPTPPLATQPRSTDMTGQAAPPQIKGAVGRIKVMAGAVNNQSEVQLKDLVTYIGSSDQAIIKIKGFLAPSLAAAISRRPEGYFFKAIKAGYPKVNGVAVTEQILLENGSLIECGSTSLMFHSGEKKAEKKKENPPQK